MVGAGLPRGRASGSARVLSFTKVRSRQGICGAFPDPCRGGNGIRLITLSVAFFILFGSAFVASAFQSLGSGGRTDQRAIPARSAMASSVSIRSGQSAVASGSLVISDPSADYYKAKWLHAKKLASWFERKRNDWRREAKRLRAASRPTRLHTSATGTASPAAPWYVSKQIWAGNILGRESRGDPWPNCPDPYDGSGSPWQGTVNCENSGSWLDSPGYYRCGLQFDPHWEIRFGRLCP